MPEVSRLQGDVVLTGADEAVQGLLRVSRAFDAAAQSSDNARQHLAAPIPSPTGQLAGQVTADLNQVKQAVTNAKPFAPLTRDIAEQAAAIEARLQEFANKRDSLRALIADSGTTAAQRRSVIDSEGRMRSNTADDQRYDTLLENAKNATSVGRSGGSPNDVRAEIEKANAAAQQLRGVLTEINNLKAQGAGGKAGALAQEYTEAARAAQQYAQAAQTARAAQEGLEQRVAQLQNRSSSLQAVVNDETASEERRAKAWALAAGSAIQLEDAQNKLSQVSAQLTRAETAERESVQALEKAETQYNKIAQRSASRTTTTTTAGSTQAAQPPALSQTITPADIGTLNALDAALLRATEAYKQLAAVGASPSLKEIASYMTAQSNAARGLAESLEKVNALQLVTAKTAAASPSASTTQSASAARVKGLTDEEKALAKVQAAKAAEAKLEEQSAAIIRRTALARLDAAGKVDFLRNELGKLNAGSLAFLKTEEQLARAEATVAREQAQAAQAGAGGAARGLLQGLGVGSILGGVGLAGGAALLSRTLTDVTRQSVDLAVKAETIGTAYEAATKRAGFASDDLLKKLDTAARGTVSDVDLMGSANKALALGVGQNAQQIGDLLAIARQKGKDFGEGTAQAFEDITVGLGRLSPRILDNLGIILDENKIYKAYADAIGVAEGKLSDQEKRQALVNELIRTNSDLIGKNATANLDAADKIARSQATIEQAKSRIGAALLPGVASAADQASIFIESITGGISGRGDEINRKLAAQASSFEDYVKRYNAAVSQLNPSGRSHAGTLDEDVGQYLALTRLTQAQVDQIRILEQSDQARTESIQTYRESTRAIQENAQAAALTKEDYDRLGTSLATLTDRGLRPYKAAVDAAKVSLDAHKASTQAASDAVAVLEGQLTKATQAHDVFAQAQLAGTKAYADQQFAIDQQSAKIQKSLLEFQAPGAGLDRLLAPIQSQIDAAAASTDDWKQKLDAANQAVSDQEQALASATAEQKNYDDAVGLAKVNLDGQQSRLEALQGVYDNLGTSIDDVRRKTEDLRRTSLVGEGALDDRLFAMDQQVKAQQLRIDQAKLGGAGKDEIKRLTEQLDRLRTAEDAARLAGELRYDKQHRALEQQGVPRDEKTLQDASAAIADNQKKQEDLTTARQAAGQAVKDQQKVVSDAKYDLMDATAAQRFATEATNAQKAALDKLKDSQKIVNDQYNEAKTRLADLQTQWNTIRTDALKPFQDQIDELGRQAQVLHLSEKLELDPLKKKIQDLQAPAELSFNAIVTGLSSTSAEIAKLTPELEKAKGLLKDEQDATKAAQVTYDAATKALEAQQKYFDALKIGLEDAKNNALVVKDILGDLGIIQGLLNQQNGIGNTGGIPGQRAPFTPGASGSGPYDVNAINSVLAKAGSPLTGQGQFIIEMSQKYGIPVEIALAMWKVEGNYGTLGASVANKNPGNLRGSPFAAGTNGGFALFDTWKAGVEGFFNLLRNDPHGYNALVDQYKKTGDTANLLKLISIYAPASDNNNPQAYYQSVLDMIKMLTQLITQQRAATGQGPLQAGEAALGLAGAQVTQGYIRPDGSVHGGIDLAGLPEGTPIHALEAGTVVASKWSDLYGNMVIVADRITGKLEEYYGHLKDRLVKEGDIVSAGDVIGTLGGTGSESTGVHLHLQLYDENGKLTDPMTELAKMFGTGKGPTEAQLQTLLTYLNGLRAVNGAMTDLGPNLPVLAGQIAGVGDSIDAVVASILDGTTAMVNATDDILDHATYKNRDGSGQLAYINQNGGLGTDAGNWTRTGGGGMSVGGPHFGDPIVTPPESMQGNDPTWGDLITATAGAATDATASVEDSAGKWTGAWHDMGDATVAEMQRAQDFMEGASANIIAYINTAIQRLDDLIAKILSIPGIHVHSGPDQHDPSDPANPGGDPSGGGGGSDGGDSGGNTTNNYNNTFYTRDSDGAIRRLRNMGYSN